MLVAPGCETSESPTALDNLAFSGLPVGADVPSRYPVGQEWRLEHDWASPADYYRGSFELYQEAIRVCMAANGFEYQPAPWYSDDIVFRVINPLNVEAAKQYGYHLPPYGASATAEHLDPSPEFSAALNEPDGCGNRAFEFSYGDASAEAARAFDAIIIGISEILPEFAATERGIEILRAWSRCMSERGYDYTSPHQAHTTYSDRDAISDDEIRVRMADLECDLEVRLTETQSDVQMAAIESWLGEHAEAVLDYRSALDRAEHQVAQRTARLSRDSAIALERPWVASD